MCGPVASKKLASSLIPAEPTFLKPVSRGGSFLCADIAASAVSPAAPTDVLDSSVNHIDFCTACEH
jgi:hypothetical protein